MTSSIHTIHRPVARSRRADQSAPSGGRSHTNRSNVKAHHEHSDSDPEDTPTSDEVEHEDFELTPRLPSAAIPPHLRIATLAQSKDTGAIPRRAPSRAGSTTTVRLQRRSHLADKLKDVFDLNDIEEVWAGLYF